MWAKGLRSYRATIPLLFCVCFIRCDFIGDNYRSHPIADSLAADPSQAIKVSHESRADPEFHRNLMRLLNNIMNPPTSVSLNPQEAEFVMIWDVKITDNGEILVLDRGADIVHVFDMNGQLRYSLGGIDNDSVQFQIPVALVILPAKDELLVVDQRSQIYRFRREEGRFRFSDRIMVDGLPHDACLGNNRIFAHVTHSDRYEILYEYSAGGAHTDVFAAPYRYSHSLPRRAMSRGQITCVPDEGLVALAVRYRGGLEAYSPHRDSLVWHTQFTDLKPTEVRESEGGSVISTGIFDNKSVHFLLSLSGGNGVPIIVQYSHTTRKDYQERTKQYTIDSYAVDPATGNGVFLGDSLPRLISLESAYAAIIHSDPYRVQIARFK